MAQWAQARPEAELAEEPSARARGGNPARVCLGYASVCVSRPRQLSKSTNKQQAGREVRASVRSTPPSGRRHSPQATSQRSQLHMHEAATLPGYGTLCDV